MAGGVGSGKEGEALLQLAEVSHKEPLGKERRHAVTMTRLRLGHCGLAWDLHKIGKHEDGLCGEWGVWQKPNSGTCPDGVCRTRSREVRVRGTAVCSGGHNTRYSEEPSGSHEDQRGIVKAVLEFMAATRQIKMD